MNRRWSLSRFREIWNVFIIVSVLVILAIRVILDQRRKEMKCPKCKTEIGLAIGTMHEPCQACKDKAYQKAKDEQEKYVTPNRWTIVVALVLITLLTLCGRAQAQEGFIKGQAYDEPNTYTCRELGIAKDVAKSFATEGIEGGNKVLTAYMLDMDCTNGGLQFFPEKQEAMYLGEKMIYVIKIRLINARLEFVCLITITPFLSGIPI